MANNTNSNPLFFDDTSGASKTGLLFLASIKWVSDEAAGADIDANDDFLVTDSNGTRIAGKRAEFAGDDYFIPYSPPGKPVNGVIVSKLDGGVCEIELY